MPRLSTYLTRHRRREEVVSLLIILPHRNNWDIDVVVKPPADPEHHRQFYASMKENISSRSLLRGCRFLVLRDAYNKL